MVLEDPVKPSLSFLSYDGKLKPNGLTLNESSFICFCDLDELYVYIGDLDEFP